MNTDQLIIRLSEEYPAYEWRVMPVKFTGGLVERRLIGAQNCDILQGWFFSGYADDYLRKYEQI